MKASEFCYWLQGLFELSNPQELDVRQTTMIKQHLALVFHHELDKQHGSPEHQAELQAMHDSKTEGMIYRC
jgi:hypothetical protein